MQLHTLKRKTANKKSRQVGRGGTRGKTSGRGTKGQNARAGRKKRPELRDFIKRFPKLRGRGVNPNKSIKAPAAAVNLDTISKLYKAGETVSVATLTEKGAIRSAKAKAVAVKILGAGELDKKVVFEGVAISAAAKSKVEKSGSEIR